MYGSARRACHFSLPFDYVKIRSPHLTFLRIPSTPDLTRFVSCSSLLASFSCFIDHFLFSMPQLPVRRLGTGSVPIKSTTLVVTWSSWSKFFDKVTHVKNAYERMSHDTQCYWLCLGYGSMVFPVTVSHCTQCT